mgnify:CR=1 FL=1
MRLYKMELFKLFQNKIFKIGMLVATGLLLLYFWFAEVGGEIATIDGKFYSGGGKYSFRSVRSCSGLYQPPERNHWKFRRPGRSLRDPAYSDQSGVMVFCYMGWRSVKHHAAS